MTKFVTIAPVDEPADFRSVRFSKADWEKAVKLGPVRVPFVSYREALRNSGGLYKALPEKEPVEVEIKGMKKPEQMSKEELVQVMTSFGKPPRKQMARQAAEDFVRKLMEDAASMIADDEDAGE